MLVQTFQYLFSRNIHVNVCCCSNWLLDLPISTIILVLLFQIFLAGCSSALLANNFRNRSSSASALAIGTFISGPQKLSDSPWDCVPVKVLECALIALQNVMSVVDHCSTPSEAWLTASAHKGPACGFFQWLPLASLSPWHLLFPFINVWWFSCPFHVYGCPQRHSDLIYFVIFVLKKHMAWFYPLQLQ